jgi:3'-phosphoadenosine 5'-phosphosulfate sulfotransferase (PAPS reductase)/FAD synthetase
MKKIVLSLSILLSLSLAVYAQNLQPKPLYGDIKPVCGCETLTKARTQTNQSRTPKQRRKNNENGVL